MTLYRELWVPADDLDEFNAHIIGKIEVVATYRGEMFEGEGNSVNDLPVGTIQ